MEDWNDIDERKITNFQLASKLLDVPPSTLTEFDATDTFNDGNRIQGHICSQSDHRYGALVISRVNDKEVGSQVVYCTPKIRYPFDRVEGDNRVYKFPPCYGVDVYEKLDGTNICAYMYQDAAGRRYVTFKTRLTPVVKESRFGNFKGMWDEMLEQYPQLRTPHVVESGKYTLSFEMYGYRNPLLIAYEHALDTRLLFGVRQIDAWVAPPNFINITPKLDPVLCIRSREDFKTIYETMRHRAETSNSKLEDGSINGIEGYVFYFLEFLGADCAIPFKCKPDMVEAIHWASEFLPMDVILPTVWSALESCDGVLNAEYVSTLLREEFTEAQVLKSHERICRAIREVEERVSWRKFVKERYDNTGLTFAVNGKREVMRRLSREFSRGQMSSVFTALRQEGLV